MILPQGETRLQIIYTVTLKIGLLSQYQISKIKCIKSKIFLGDRKIALKLKAACD